MDMNNLDNLPNRSAKWLERTTRRKLKAVRQAMNKSNLSKQYLFIVGCQRSGTSMTYKIFEHDPNAGVYDEISILSSQDKKEKLRLNPLPAVLEKMKTNPASLVVSKPLVESQNLIQLLDYFPNSSAIWMFRSYKDVVSSNLKRFGASNGQSDISPVLNSDLSNWRAENLSSDMTQKIKQLASETDAQADAAALFWLGRNSHFFRQKLQSDRRVFLCNYDKLVSRPVETVQLMYGFLDRPLPNESLTNSINNKSIGKGSSVDLTDNIVSECEIMYQRLVSNEQN